MARARNTLRQRRSNTHEHIRQIQGCTRQLNLRAEVDREAGVVRFTLLSFEVVHEATSIADARAWVLQQCAARAASEASS